MYSTTKITAIIQARMTSTRLPGKVLMEVMGRPLLSYQLERLRVSREIDEIIVATTTNEEDDPIVMLAQKEGLASFRGSEEDVLDRYYQAANLYGVQHIMRLTADCPLIQPDICDVIAREYFDTNADYTFTGPSFAEGLSCEMIRFRALERAWKEARRKSEREHVTLYIRNHPEKFRSLTVEHDSDQSRYRITVDEREDFLVVRAILEHLYRKSHCFTMNEIKPFLDTHPEVYSLNAHIVRNQGLLKSLQADL